MSRGGKRTGAGRPRKEGERIPFRCELPKDAHDILKEEARTQGKSRTEVLTTLLRGIRK